MKKIIKTFLSDAVVLLTLLFAPYAESPEMTQADRDKYAIDHLQFVEENTEKDRADICAWLPDCLWLAKAIAGEAGNQPMLGKKLVGKVILQRSKERGLSIESVIKEPNQFAFLSESLKEPVEKELTLAYNLMFGLVNVPYDVNHFYNPRKVKRPKWARKKWFRLKVADHSFYNVEV